MTKSTRLTHDVQLSVSVQLIVPPSPFLAFSLCQRLSINFSSYLMFNFQGYGIKTNINTQSHQDNEMDNL